MNWKVDALTRGETIVSKESGNSMTPILKSRQPVKLAPILWGNANIGDIVFCKVHGNFYTHLVKAININRGCLIGNNHGHTNGWTKKVFGKVVEIIKEKV